MIKQSIFWKALTLIIALNFFVSLSFATPDKAGRVHPFEQQYKSPGTGGPTDDYPQMPGWPVTMGTAFFSPMEGPIQVDIDGDGDLEIFAASTDGMIYGWHHNGAYVSGFPVNCGGYFQTSPAAGDIDGNGDLEILAGNRNGNVYAYHHNGTPVAGWPRTTGDEIAINSVTLWDFDGNGDCEVMIGSDRLYVWDGNGMNWPGFPVNFSGAQYGTCSSSAVGDIDGDGDVEIILEGWDYLNAFHHNGQMVTGWPYQIPSGGFSYSAPSLVDIDGDDCLEIFCASHGTPSYLYGIRGNGANLPGFPQNIAGWTYSTPAIGDMNHDAEVEIMLLCNTAILYAFKTDGSAVPGWPINFGVYNCEAAVVMCDFDNNGLMDILFGTNGGPAQYKCYRADGTPHPDFPFTIDGATLPTCSAIADADNDGDMEIAHHIMNGTVYLWTSPYPANLAYKPWRFPHHDVQHTGNFHHHDNYNVAINLTYISIPPLFYNIAVNNIGTITANFDIWCMVRLPNGIMYGPLLGPVNFTLNTGASANRDRIQNIPASAPAGDYTFFGYIGNYPVEIAASDSFNFTIVPGDGATSIAEWENSGESWSTNDLISLPSDIKLLTCYPNPFNSTTTIRFTLEQSGYVSLAIYDISGREIAKLLNGWKPVGTNEISFKGDNLGSGIYLIHLLGQGYSETIKLVLIK